MFKKVHSSFKDFFKAPPRPTVSKPSITLEALHGALDDAMSPDERRAQENLIEIALRNMDMQHDVQQKNLDIQHATMLTQHKMMLITLTGIVITFILAVISLTTTIYVATHDKPNITVKPLIEVNSKN